MAREMGEIFRQASVGEFRVRILSEGKGASSNTKIAVAKALMEGRCDRVDGSIEDARKRLAPYRRGDVIEKTLKKARDSKRTTGIYPAEIWKRGGSAWRVADNYLSTQIRERATWQFSDTSLQDLLFDANEKGDEMDAPPWRMSVCHPDNLPMEDLTNCLVSEWPGTRPTSPRLEIIPCSRVDEIPQHCQNFSGRMMALIRVERGNCEDVNRIMSMESTGGVEWFFLESPVDEMTAECMVDAMLDGRGIGAIPMVDTGIGMDLEVGVREFYRRFACDDQGDWVYEIAHELPESTQGPKITLQRLANALLREPPAQWSNPNSFHARFDTWAEGVLHQRFGFEQ